MSWLALLAAAAVVNLLVAELFGWCPWIAERLIRRAVGGLPIKARDRYLDEWLAEFEALPARGISSLLFALRILMGASRVRNELAGHVTGISIVGLVCKRALDGSTAAAGVVFFAPIFLCVTLAVRLSSRGPTLSRECCVGRDGKVFELYRFRTTHLLARRTDPSDDCTAVGRFLDRTSLSELPQILNVLRGDMSVIGPSPARLEVVELYKRMINRYDDRHEVKPGITGWAQIHASHSLAERVELDSYYIAHWSLWLDLKILALTVVAALRGHV